MPSIPYKTDLPILLILPAFCESQRLDSFLEPLVTRMAVACPHARLAVCDDGSGQDEVRRLAALVDPLRERFPQLQASICLSKNRGKGGAILAGWEAYAEGAEVLGFVDADGAISAQEVCRVASLLEAGGPALFASRVKMMGRRVERSFTRHVTARLFASMVGSLIEPEIYDSQCGLKFIPAAAFRQVEPWLKGHRFAFDVELIAALRKAGVPMEEVPIDWVDIPGSKVSLWRDTWRMLQSVLAIRKAREDWG